MRDFFTATTLLEDERHHTPRDAIIRLCIQMRLLDGPPAVVLICDQASLYFRGGKVRLIQLLEYLSVASPESGVFSDWSRNKRYLELNH